MPTEVQEKMDAAADEARTDLVAVIAQHPEATEAIGKWAAKHKNAAGYKRLGIIIVALGKEA